MVFSSYTAFSILLSLATLLPVLSSAQGTLNELSHAHASYLLGRGRRHQRLAAKQKLGGNSTSENHHHKRGGAARFTFYQTGLGACGKYNNPDDFIVAINAEQWAGGSHCDETITITYGGKTTNAQVADLCLSCPRQALDMSPALFSFFADERQGMIFGDWHFGEDARTTSTASSSMSKPKPSKTALPLSTLHTQHRTTTTTTLSSVTVTSTENVPSSISTPSQVTESDLNSATHHNLENFDAILAGLGFMVSDTMGPNSQTS